MPLGLIRGERIGKPNGAQEPVRRDVRRISAIIPSELTEIVVALTEKVATH